FQMAVAAREKNPDHRFGPRRMVRPAVGRSLGRRFARLDVAVALQHRRQRQAGETQAQVGEEGSARDAAATGVGIRFHSTSQAISYRTVTKSLWLNSARTKLSRARMAGSLEPTSVFASAWRYTSRCFVKKLPQDSNSVAVGRRVRTFSKAATM